MREDEVGIADDLRGLGVLLPREQPVGPVEHRRVARHGQAELLQIGLGVPAQRPLRAVEGDPDLK